MAERVEIIVADDQANMRKILKAILEKEGYHVILAANGEEVLELVNTREVATVITDLKMPGIDGMEVLTRLNTTHPQLPVILITAHGTIQTAVVAMKKGALDYITKPFEKNEILQCVDKAIKTYYLSKHELAYDAHINGRFQLIGNSPQMRQVYEIVDKVAASPTTILILGESGTGKELIAKAIHENSHVADQPFIRINCAAIPENLLESELFGYEKGAFTGAVTSKPGRFELADGGTLFLDEIGEIPREMQVKLLRCLQEQEFERVGGIKTIRVNVRLLAATNTNLEEEVRKGTFRQDLYYRLNVVPIHLPALRERTEDIPLLVEHFLKKFNKKLGKKVKKVTEEVMDSFIKYPWPGNIRELENVMERCVLLTPDDRITPELLPDAFKGAPATGMAIQATLEPGTSLKEAVKKQTSILERSIILDALRETSGNITKAAKKLGISRKGLQTKMKEYNLRDEL